MAKKKLRLGQQIKPQQQTVASSKRNEQESPAPQPGQFWSIRGFRLQALIVVVLSLAFYYNSFLNEYALDDGIVIVKNEYVQEGTSGIFDILTKDAYDSYYRQLNSSNELKGGRYRPLSIVTFAVEQEFMGSLDKDSVKAILQQNMLSGIGPEQKEKINHEMHVRHVLNVVWYILSLLALLYFLRYIVFRGNPLMALIAAVIFTIHPIHTEVVANVKSRDEIMSLLFICLTFIFTFKYQEYKKKWIYGAAIGSYFMALLSKEYAITLVILLPLSLYLFNGNSIKKSITTFLPFFGAIAVYMLLRLHTSASANESSDNEVLNNPYLFASYNEEFATKIATAFNYIKLLVWPHPLSADYSYNSIPYKDFDSPWVWLSLVVYAGLAFIIFRFFPKKPPTVYQPSAKRQHLAQSNYRSILCFAIAFYLLNFLLICNWIFNIGGTMGERLIYHSSVGFAIAAGYLIYSGFDRLRPRRTAMILLSIFMVLMVLLSGYKTITRNAEWKNNETLFSADIKTVPNSVIVLGNLVNSLIDNADLLTDSIARRVSLNKAVNLATRAIEIDPVYVAGFFNRGLALFKLGEIDKSRDNMDSVKAHYYNYPALPSMYKTISLAYMKKGIDPYAKNGRWTEALGEFRKGLAIDSTNAELWFNTGVALYAVHDASGAINAWQTTLRLDPGYGPAKQDLNFALQQVSQNNTGK